MTTIQTEGWILDAITKDCQKRLLVVEPDSVTNPQSTTPLARTTRVDQQLVVLGDVRRVQFVGLNVGRRQTTQIYAVAYVTRTILIGHGATASHAAEGIVDVEFATARINARDGRPTPAVPRCRCAFGQGLGQRLVHGFQYSAGGVQCATGDRSGRQRIDHGALRRTDMNRLVGAFVVRHFGADAEKQCDIDGGA